MIAAHEDPSRRRVVRYGELVRSFEAQAARLAATEWAQPAIGTVSLSMLALLDRLGLRPAHAGGHSYGEITAKKGRIQQSNFDDFEMARIDDSPQVIEVEIVPSDYPPAGVGEVGVPTFAPALCNAIFAATGKRIRRLPLSRHDLSWS